MHARTCTCTCPYAGFYTKEGWFVDVPNTNGSKVKKFTIEQRRPRMVRSIVVILCLTVLAAGAAGALYADATRLMTEYHDRGLPHAIDFALLRPYATIIGKYGGMVRASVFIALTNLAFTFIARKLTDSENHRTETEYEDAYIVKVAVFQFVNSYIALYYVAFVKSGLVFDGELFGVHEWCHDLQHFDLSAAGIKELNHGDNPFCMAELQALMRTFVIVSQVMQQVIGFVVPWLLAQLRGWQEEWWLMHMDYDKDPSLFAQQLQSGGTGARPCCWAHELPRHMRLLRALLCPCSGWRGTESRPWPPPMSVYEESSKLKKFDEATGLSGVINRYGACHLSTILPPRCLHPASTLPSSYQPELSGTLTGTRRSSCRSATLCSSRRPFP